jgi:hypothetical protein
VKRILVLAACALAPLLLAGPADAEIVATIPPGSYFTDLSIAPTGAVWVASAGPTRARSAIGQVVGDGVRWASFPVVGAPLGGTSENAVFARADGRVWGFLGGRVAVRPTATGFVSTALLRPGEYNSGVGVPADGGAMILPNLDQSFERIGLDGSRTTVRYTAPPAARGRTDCSLERMSAAPDGTLLADDGCDRLLRLRVDGTVVGTIPDAGSGVLVGLAGDMWLQNSFSVTHRVAGVDKEIELPFEHSVLGPWALAPDGTVWAATAGGCRLLHITDAGVAANIPAPMNAEVLAVASDGALWLHNHNQVAHVTPSAPEQARCDERVPTVRLPDVKRGRVSIAALRRHHGLRITSSEPGTLNGIATVAGVHLKPQQGVDRRGTVLRFSDRLLRRLARGGRLDLRFLAVWDANTNGGRPRELVRVVP